MIDSEPAFVFIDIGNLNYPANEAKRDANLANAAIFNLRFLSSCAGLFACGQNDSELIMSFRNNIQMLYQAQARMRKFSSSNLGLGPEVLNARSISINSSRNSIRRAEVKREQLRRVL